MDNNLKIALCQIDIVWENAAATIAAIENGIYDFCKEYRPDIIVLPETYSVGFTMNPDVAEPADGISVRWLKKTASTLNAAVVASVPTVEANGNRYNRCYFIEPDGTKYCYDKRHLFNYSGEGKTYVPGSGKCTLDYRGWKIQLNICYDLRFPVWSRNKGNNYDILINIANWPDTRVEAARTLIRARAIENCSYALFCNRKGTDAFCNYNGMSAIVDYFGNSIAKETESSGVTILSAQLSKEELESYRTKFPAWRDADDFELKVI